MRRIMLGFGCVAIQLLKVRHISPKRFPCLKPTNFMDVYLSFKLLCVVYSARYSRFHNKRKLKTKDTFSRVLKFDYFKYKTTEILFL